MSKRLTTADLAKLIQKHPNAVFTVDNDCWWMEAEPEENNPHDEESEDEDEAKKAYRWQEKNRICSDRDMGYSGGGYGSGSSYGGDILQALAHIVGVTIESV